MIIVLLIGFVFGIAFCAWARRRIRQFDEMMKAFDPKPASPKDDDFDYLCRHVPAFLRKQAK